MLKRLRRLPKRGRPRLIRNSKTPERSWAKSGKKPSKLLKKSTMKPSRMQSKQLLSSKMPSMIMKRLESEMKLKEPESSTIWRKRSWSRSITMPSDSQKTKNARPNKGEPTLIGLPELKREPLRPKECNFKTRRPSLLSKRSKRSLTRRS